MEIKVVKTAKVEPVRPKDLRVGDEILKGRSRWRIDKINWEARTLYITNVSDPEDSSALPDRFEVYDVYYRIIECREAYIRICSRCGKEIESGDMCDRCREEVKLKSSTQSYGAQVSE